MHGRVLSVGKNLSQNMSSIFYARGAIKQIKQGVGYLHETLVVELLKKKPEEFK
jgi:hypothetical protein